MRTLLVSTILALWMIPASAQNGLPKMPSDAKKKFDAAMRSTLKDPFSAQYRDVVFTKHPNGEYVFCGYVNSKNSYGGYIGDRLFIAIAEGSLVEASVSSDVDFVIRGYRDLCRKHGLVVN